MAEALKKRRWILFECPACHFRRFYARFSEHGGFIGIGSLKVYVCERCGTRLLLKNDWLWFLAFGLIGCGISLIIVLQLPDDFLRHKPESIDKILALCVGLLMFPPLSTFVSWLVHRWEQPESS